ncbi:MAG: DUF2953 domain-containing protein [Lachnospiraceae bacterium]|nr:DUF2953 domain-containing protein [Lachnospiraceae bacterium]
MVAILLLILKIIGILLLVLLELALVFIILLLFYPLSYRLIGEIPDMEHRRICFRAHWLLFVARFSLMLDETNEPQMCLRIFGIPVWRSPGKVRRSKKRKKIVDDPFEEENQETAVTEENQEAAVDYDIQAQEIAVSTDDDQASEASVPHAVKRFFDKIRIFWRCIRTLPDRIQTFFHNLHRKSQDLGKIIKDENNRQAFGMLWTELLSLLKRYGPKRVCADVDFGTNDPALTGQILAVLSMMPFLFGRNISIRPDFESEQLYVKGTFDIRGRIQTYHMLGSLIRLYKDKKIKRLLKQLRK